MTEQNRLDYIAAIYKAQTTYDHTHLHRCPRCGRGLRMPYLHNALSRHATVYVCNSCGTYEALLDAVKAVVPLTQWTAIQNLETAGEFPSRPTLLAIEPEVTGDCVEVTFECWFDIAKKLGVNLESYEGDAWINLYASYNVKTEELQIFYTVDDTELNESYYYIPTESERISVIDNMEQCCKLKGYTMSQMVADCASYSEVDEDA